MGSTNEHNAAMNLVPWVPRNEEDAPFQELRQRRKRRVESRFGCLKSPSICCAGLCWCCLHAANDRKLFGDEGRSACTLCLLSSPFPCFCVGLCYTSSEIQKQKHKLAHVGDYEHTQSSLFCDCICAPCVVCQIAREIRLRDPNNPRTQNLLQRQEVLRARSEQNEQMRSKIVSEHITANLPDRPRRIIPQKASFSRHNPESFFLVPPSGAIGILAKKEERRKGICDRHSVYSEALSFHSDSSSGSEDVDMPVSPPSSCLGSPDGTTVDTSPFPVGSHDSPHSQRPSWSFSAEPLDLLPNESHQC